MSLNMRGLRAARVRDNEAALAQIKTRMQRLQREQAGANALLAEAKRAADDLERQMRVLQEMERNMAEELAASHADLVQECVATLPDDILRCIFAEAVSDGEAQAPFAIAAVCAKWRRVSLDFPSMWSTIHILCDPLADAVECQRRFQAGHERAVVLLARSGSAPLNITIAAKSTISQQNLLLVRCLFDLLGAHVSRWRTATLILPASADRAWMDFLKGPTPLLVELNMGGFSRDRARGPSESEYLPFAPRLTTLHIGEKFCMGCSTRHGFPALRHLVLLPGACTETQVFDYARMSSRSLESLTLCPRITHGPGATIDLPKLTLLALLYTSFPLVSQPVPAIRTPMLQHLDLGPRQSDDINDTFLPFLDAVSRTVRQLSLTQSVTASSLPILARLANVEILNLYVSTAYIRNDALELLSNSDPPIWPRLVRIRNWVFSADATDNGWSPHKFLEFIASRNLPAQDGNKPNATRPCKLREVELDQNAPHWFVAEVNRLLAL